MGAMRQPGQPQPGIHASNQRRITVFPRPGAVKGAMTVSDYSALHRPGGY
jgi:hypothetical protein